jgi:hypothetical protein
MARLQPNPFVISVLKHVHNLILYKILTMLSVLIYDIRCETSCYSFKTIMRRKADDVDKDISNTQNFKI